MHQTPAVRNLVFERAVIELRQNITSNPGHGAAQPPATLVRRALAPFQAHPRAAHTSPFKDHKNGQDVPLMPLPSFARQVRELRTELRVSPFLLMGYVSAQDKELFLKSLQTIASNPGSPVSAKAFRNITTMRKNKKTRDLGLEAIHSDSEARRLAAIGTILRLGSQNCTIVLSEIVQSSRFQDTREAALYALGRASVHSRN